MWIEWLGESDGVTAHAFGVHPATIYALVRHGRTAATCWQQLLLLKH